MVDLKDLAHELALPSAIEVGRWLDDCGAGYIGNPAVLFLTSLPRDVCSTLD